MEWYSISTVCQITGLSRTTLLYYEAKGLITPHQSGESNYRTYNMQDIMQIMFYQSLKPLGISVEEYAAASNASGADAKHEDMMDIILPKKAAHLKRLSFFINMWEDTILFANMLRRQGRVCRLQDSKEAWAFSLNQPDSAMRKNILRDWNEHFMQRNLSYFFNTGAALGEPIRFSRALTCYADCTVSLPQEMMTSLTYIPSRPSLLIAEPIDMRREDFSELFAYAGEELKRRGLTAVDEPWGNTGFRDNVNETLSDYFFLWIPIARATSKK